MAFDITNLAWPRYVVKGISLDKLVISNAILITPKVL
jgi:hypothetical protein